MDKPNVQFVPDTLFSVGPLNFSTGHLAMFVIVILISVVLVSIASRAKLKPSRAQLALEAVLVWFLEKVEKSFSNKKVARRIFPLIMTMFFVILVSNLFSILPFVDALTFGDGVPLLRAPTSDVSMTLALGIFSVVLSHVIAFIKSPLGHLSNYFTIMPVFKAKNGGEFGQALFDFFLHLYDIIGEMAKIVSISFRLFGNIFSGVAMAAVFGFLAPYIIPMPFNVIGIFSGCIQAVVFSLLALQFLSSPLASVEGNE